MLSEDTWTWEDLEKSEGQLPSRRYGHTMSIHNRNIFVFGGYDDFGYRCNDLYEYRPTSNTWRKVKTIGDAPERYHHSAVIHMGSMYVFGGSVADMSTATALFEYRFGTATWTRVPTQNKAPEGRWGHSSFVHNNQLYIVGGCDNILCFKDVYRISLESFIWKKVKKLCGFDPRYFGGCLVVQSNVETCEPSLDTTTEPEESATPSDKPTSSVPPGLIYHSQAVAQAMTAKAAAARVSSSAPQTTSARSSNDGIPPSTVTPPLPAVTPVSTLPTASSIGLGWKLLYHGGRNIHNWAFNDILILSLDGEDAPNPFQTQMASLVGNGAHSDVAFVFPHEPQTPPLHAHKAILAIRCEPFAKMFLMSMKEANQGEIEIVDVPSALFRLFLSFLYTGTLPALDTLHDNIRMLYLSDQYFLSHLKTVCESRLKSLLSTTSVAQLWDAAQAAHAASLQRACIKFVVLYSDVLLTSEGKKTLPKPLVIEAKHRLAQINSSSSS